MHALESSNATDPPAARLASTLPPALQGPLHVQYSAVDRLRALQEPPDNALRILGLLTYQAGEGYALTKDGEIIAKGRYLVDLITGIGQIRPHLPGVPHSGRMMLLKKKLLGAADRYRNEGESLSQMLAVALRREVDRRRELEIAEFAQMEADAREWAMLDAGWRALATVAVVGHA